MQILFVTHYTKLYGANISLLYLAKYMKEIYHEDVFVLVNGLGDFTDELKKNNIPYIKAKYFSNTVNVNKKLATLKSIAKCLMNIVLYRITYILLKRRFTFDFIHSNSSVISIGFFLAKKFKIKHIWHIREFGYEDYNLKYLPSFNAQIKKYIQSNCLIAISNSINNALRSFSPNINSIVIYNGIDQINNEYTKNFEIDIVNFAIVGRLSASKNQLEAVKAAHCLLENGIDKFRLYIFGDGDNKYKSKIEEYIIKEQLDGNVFLMGYKYDILENLKDMNVGIVTSKKEAFGRVTIEFMMNYMPVIGTNQGGNLELIDNGINGFIYSLNDVQELAMTMKLFLDSKPILKKMGLEAKKKSKDFTSKKNAEKIHNLYLELLK